MEKETLHIRRAWIDGASDPEVAAIRRTLETAASCLDFDPGPHVYTDRETGAHPVCVSDIVGSFTTFDSVAKAEACSRRDARTPGSKYYGMTPEQILERWDKAGEQASSRGTLMHTFAEACFCVATGIPGSSDKRWYCRISDDGHSIDAVEPEERAIVAAFRWMPDHLVPVVKECRVYNRTYGYAGTLDLLSFDTCIRSCVLLDWKTNVTLEKCRLSRMLPPFGMFWDNALGHYSVQQPLYQIPLEDLGIRLAYRFLLHVAPTGIFTPVPVGDCTGIIRTMLEERRAAGLRADGKPENIK